jgi:hypothetical protein
MNRIALTSSSSESFLPFANSEKGDPNCGISFSFAPSTLTRYRLDCGFERYHVCSPVASRGLSGIDHRGNVRLFPPNKQGKCVTGENVEAQDFACVLPLRSR